EAMDGENTLLFASDYPHWDYDDVNTLHIPPEWRGKVLGQNALDVYKRIPRPQAAAAA
ncbi:MAG: amidohydrolase, partial [Mesorhizobium sp.]